MSGQVCGFDPVYDGNSKLLILGSFPSVKSRQVEFYYGNRQNRFWKVLCSYFGEDIPPTTDGKIDFLHRHGIALWDIVTKCEIVGSQDATITNYEVADIDALLRNCPIKRIILNGGKACSIFEKHYSNIGVPYIKLPSTSPANTRFSAEEWYNAISSTFTCTQ